MVNAWTCWPGRGSCRQSLMWKTIMNSPRKWEPLLRCLWYGAKPKEWKMTTAPYQPLNALGKIGSCHPETHRWVARNITWDNQGRPWHMLRHSNIGWREWRHQPQWALPIGGKCLGAEAGHGAIYDIPRFWDPWQWHHSMRLWSLPQPLSPPQVVFFSGLQWKMTRA